MINVASDCMQCSLSEPHGHSLISSARSAIYTQATRLLATSQRRKGVDGGDWAVPLTLNCRPLFPVPCLSALTSMPRRDGFLVSCPDGFLVSHPGGFLVSRPGGFLVSCPGGFLVSRPGGSSCHLLTGSVCHVLTGSSCHVLAVPRVTS